jgi:hypothetical protein
VAYTRPGRARQEAERQKRGNNLRLVELEHGRTSFPICVCWYARAGVHARASRFAANVYVLKIVDWTKGKGNKS